MDLSACLPRARVVALTSQGIALLLFAALVSISIESVSAVFEPNSHLCLLHRHVRHPAGAVPANPDIESKTSIVHQLGGISSCCDVDRVRTSIVHVFPIVSTVNR